MQLDDGRAGAGSGFDLCGIGVDEQRHADAGLGQQADRVRHRRQGAGHFQPALGSQLGAFSGTGQTSLGLTAQAISSISGVTAHSRFMRVRNRGRMA